MWTCTLLLAVCCTFTHGAELAVIAGCALLVAFGAAWSTHHR